jgi:hypothetical protein
VDDLLVADFHETAASTLTNALSTAYGKVKVQLGPTLVYLGIHIEKKGRAFHLHQRPLLLTIDYPAPKGRVNNAASSDILDRSPSQPAQDPARFRSSLMRLLYVTSKTRFDLMFPVSVLAGRQQCCTERDEASLSNLIAYAQNTADLCLIINPTNASLSASADASYACHEDARGHSGIVCSIGGTTIYARSTKQQLVAKSSTEAELLALNGAADELLYLRNIMVELGFPQLKPSPIFQDNQSAIIMAHKGELGTKRTKHFTMRHYFIKEQLDEQRVLLVHQPGITIAADGLTKPLTGPRARSWTRALLSGATHLTLQTVRRGVLDSLPVVPSRLSDRVT